MQVPKLTLLLLLLTAGIFSHAQLLTINPTIPRETGNLTITVDVSKGNRGLLGYANTNDVYVHVGAIVNDNGSDWRGVPFTWGSAEPAAKATYLGDNRYSYTINNVRQFFNIPDGTPIYKVAILFRNGAGDKVQRNDDGSDMYVQIFGESLSGKFLYPPFQPKFIPLPEPGIIQMGEPVEFRYVVNKQAKINLSIDGSPVATELSSNIITYETLITTSGNHRVIVDAEAGTEEFSDTLDFYIPPTTETAPVPAGMRQGINYVNDNTVVLVLFAPEKDRVMVVGDFNDWKEEEAYQMKRDPDGERYWLQIDGLQPGIQYAYQYKVDDIFIADPYAELVLDPQNDGYISSETYPNLKAYPTGKATGYVSVLETGKPEYQWKHNFTRPDKRNLIIYELLLRDFLEKSNWQTLKDTLGYLQRLGVNAIELLPFNEFEGNISWGYNPAFYFAPDKYYGPPEKLKEFIDECHRLGIAVIMDIALNHQFGQSPMVRMYWDAANNRPAANSPWFNPVPRHAFNVGYDMNHESPATKYFTERVIEYWLKEYRIDGFRFDLSKGFTQKNTCDANGNNCNVDAWSQLDESRINIWKHYYDVVQSTSDGAYVILEHLGHNDEEKILSDYGMMLWGNLNYNYTEASMGWVGNSNISWGFHTARGWSDPHLITYAESHDEERIVYKNVQFGNASGSYNVKEQNTALRRAELAAAFLLTIPGPKMIWQFGELGYDLSINRCENGSVSENCRTAPKPPRWEYQSVTARKRLFDVYSGLIKLRTHPYYDAAFKSDRVQYNTSGALKWIVINTDTSNLVVVGNFDVVSGNVSVTFPQAGTWYDYFSGQTITATGGSQVIPLEPGEYKVYVNRNISHLLTPVSNIEYLEANTNLNVYPNPAGFHSFIDFEIPESGMVNLRLISLRGQSHPLTLSSHRMKGKHRVSLKDLPGAASIASGSYIVLLEFEGVRKSRQVFINR